MLIVDRVKTMGVALTVTVKWQFVYKTAKETESRLSLC